ncbi:MAG: thioredoxin family protein [Chloroflexi bacterium]|nr:thioredoxin family protein [Chloroflexota bacterium]
MRRHLLLAVAAISCPCYLPILGAVLAGTALGGLIAETYPVLFVALGLLFAGSLWLWSRQTFVAQAAAPAAPASAAPPALAEPQHAPGRGAPAVEPLQLQILKTSGCASCAGVERSWKAIRPRYEDRVHVQVIDLLERPDVAERHRVLRTPALVIDGRLRAQGALDAARLERLLDEALEARVAAAAPAASR